MLWGNEMDSPRGRIYLMKMASEGATAMTDPWVQHIDTCLGCMSCMTACPSGVDYAKLIEATRAQIERRHPRSTAERLQRWMIFSTFPRVDRLRLLRPFLRAYQKSDFSLWFADRDSEAPSQAAWRDGSADARARRQPDDSSRHSRAGPETTPGERTLAVTRSAP